LQETHVTSESILIFGAGGYGRCVADTARLAGFEVAAFVDIAAREPMFGAPVLSEAEVFASSDLPRAGVVALGDNALRERTVEAIRKQWPDFRFVTVVHPRACVADSAVIEEGGVVLAGAVINPAAVLGAHASIYTNAIVEHDAVLDAYVTLAPGAVTAGTTRIGRRSFVGLNACISHGVTVGDDVVIGAASAVIKPLAALSVAVGAPARVVRERKVGERYL
jgi:sugar O-acyltransferase (sialic acid O-acetyltransferase NeuD family)